MSTTTTKPTPNPFRYSGIPVSQASVARGVGQFNKYNGVLPGEVTSEFESSFTDSSSTLFSQYLSYADKHDKEQAESWKASAEGTLVFTGLFAAALATFVIDSYKSLLPDSAGNAVVLLSQISRQLDGLSNGTQVPITASLTSISPQSSTQRSAPPASAVWVNSLWFLSLVISLFCSLLATLQQRWARRYLQVTQPHVAIHERARIRSYFAKGVTRFRVSVTVEAIPALLHISVFLLLAGLIVSLFRIHHTIAYVVLAATAVCSLVYAAITVMPVICHDSPYTSPFSALAWYIPRKTALAVVNTVDRVMDFIGKYSSFVCRRKCWTMPSLREKVLSYKKFFSEDMTEAAHDAAKRAKSQLDARALGWTLDQLDEEGELVKFATVIPGFSRSTGVKGAVSILKRAPKFSIHYKSLYRHIALLLIRASKPELLHDSKLLPESVRQQRTTVCLVALYYLPHAIEKILYRMASRHTRKVVAGFSPIFQSAESWIIAERLSEPNDRIDVGVTIGAQCMAAVIASQPPDEQMQPILMRHLKIEEPHIFSRYLEPFDSALLKNLNQFLEDTALKYIDMEDFSIIRWTLRLVKRPKLKHAVQELQDKFNVLLDRIYEHATQSTGRASSNARQLLQLLDEILIGSLHPAATYACAQRSSPSGSLSLNGPTAATLMSVSTPPTPKRLSRLRPLLLVSPRSSDTCISMDSVTSPMSPNDSLPMSP
ncbi:hypothetical protein F5888DRAFT_1742198 [Russula emetica]|nr:hypothetical protein F5888DRAFT_1742198 [Russula emetica]